MTEGQWNRGRKRLIWIDQARGVAMLLVILGHAQLGKVSQSFIYSFHMPLFFIISGLTFQKEKARNQRLGAYLVKHGKRLVVPYFWCNFAMFPMWFLQHRVLTRVQDEGFFSVLKGIFYSNSLVMDATANPTWFFLTLFLALAGYKIVLNLSRGDEWKELVLVITCGFLAFADRGKDLPWHLNTSFCGIVFLYLGTKLMEIGYSDRDGAIYGWMKRKGPIGRKCRCLAVMIAAGLLCWRVNGRVSMHGNKYGKSLLLFYVTAILFSCVIVQICIWLPRIRMLTYIGRHTILLVALHTSLLQLGRWFFPVFGQSRGYALLLAVLVTLLLLPVTAGLIRLAPFLEGCESEGRTANCVGRVVMTYAAACIPFYYALRTVGINMRGNFSMGLGMNVLLLLLCIAFVLWARRRCPLIFLDRCPDGNGF